MPCILANTPTTSSPTMTVSPPLADGGLSSASLLQPCRQPVRVAAPFGLLQISFGLPFSIALRLHDNFQLLYLGPERPGQHQVRAEKSRAQGGGAAKSCISRNKGVCCWSNEVIPLLHWIRILSLQNHAG